jgi:hypothetical protein
MAQSGLGLVEFASSYEALHLMFSIAESDPHSEMGTLYLFEYEQKQNNFAGGQLRP